MSKSLLALLFAVVLIGCSKNKGDAPLELVGSSNNTSKTPAGSSNGDEVMSEIIPSINPKLPSLMGSIAVISEKSVLFSAQKDIERRFGLEIEKVDKTKKSSMGIMYAIGHKYNVCQVLDFEIEEAQMDQSMMRSSEDIFGLLKNFDIADGRESTANLGDNTTQSSNTLPNNITANDDLALVGMILGLDNVDGSMSLRLIANPKVELNEKVKNQFRQYFAKSLFTACICISNPGLKGCEDRRL